MAKQWPMNSPIIEIYSSSVLGLHYGLLFYSDIDISRQLHIWYELRDIWMVLSIQPKYFFYMEATLEFILS